MEGSIVCGVDGSKVPNSCWQSSTLPGCAGAVDPDLFVSAVFVSWVMLIALLGVALMRYERRREDLAPQVDNLAQAPSRRGRLTVGQVRAGAPADRWAPGDTVSA